MKLSDGHTLAYHSNRGPSLAAYSVGKPQGRGGIKALTGDCANQPNVLWARYPVISKMSTWTKIDK